MKAHRHTRFYRLDRAPDSCRWWSRCRSNFASSRWRRAQISRNSPARSRGTARSSFPWRDAGKAAELRDRLRAAGGDPTLPEIQQGREGLLSVATHPDAAMVVSAAVGVVGLEATYAAVRAGKQVALSNKEVLVAAGELVMAAAKAKGVELLPVDSEHNAIHQCLRAGRPCRGAPADPDGFRRPVPQDAARADGRRPLRNRRWRIRTGAWASGSRSIRRRWSTRASR